MRALLTPAVGLPLVGIFTMQTALTLAAYAFPIVIPVAAADLGISPEAVGFFTGAIYLVGMMAGLMTGKLLARFGPTRWRFLPVEPGTFSGLPGDAIRSRRHLPFEVPIQWCHWPAM